MRILIAAGEVSGDKQAACLARAIRVQRKDVSMYGTGGQRLAAEGVDVLAKTAHMGTVGLQESLRFFKPLRAALGDLRSSVRSDPPDLGILVDNEGFNLTLA